MIKVPFADLYAQYISIKGSIDKAIEKTIASSSYIGGKDIPAFEVAFPAYLQMKHVIGCGNGTDSIEIILKALGIGSGDEVDRAFQLMDQYIQSCKQCGGNACVC